jgi:glucose/arabinose dehydrogenase
MRSARAVVVATVLALLAGSCGGGGEDPGPREDRPPRTAAPTRQPAKTEVITTGLVVPWDIAFLPDGRALVTERPGRIRIVSPRGELQRDPVAEIPVEAEGEGGLMGLALDPEFGEEQPYAYAMATAGGQVRVLRLRWAGNRLQQEATILDGIEAGRIHDSGRLRFGPDERLYVVTGDAGRSSLAQLRTSRNGKVLALTPDQYRGDEPAGPAIVSIGHRNPQGLDWEPGSDQLYVSEHGPSGFDGPSCCDELNRVRQGRDYGWPRFGADQPEAATPAKLWEDTIAPSGIAFVKREGSAWTGNVLVAALRGRALHRLQIDEDRAQEVEVLLEGDYGRLRTVVEAPDGSLWVTTSNLDDYGERTSRQDDRILRIVPPRG